MQRFVGPTCGASLPAGAAGSLTVGLFCGLGVGCTRGYSVRTGVSDEEAFGSLPGDEVILHPMVEWTRGLAVHNTPQALGLLAVSLGLFDATYGVAMLRAIARRAEGRAPA